MIMTTRRNQTSSCILRGSNSEGKAIVFLGELNRCLGNARSKREDANEGPETVDFIESIFSSFV